MVKTIPADRKCLRSRLSPLPWLPPAERIHPTPASATLPPWLQKIAVSKPGFFDLSFERLEDHRFVVFGCSLRGQCWGMFLESRSSRSFYLRFAALAGELGCLNDLFAAKGISSDEQAVRVVSLTMVYKDQDDGGIQVPECLFA